MCYDVWEEIAAVPNCLQGLGLVEQIVALWPHSAASVKPHMSDESVMRSCLVDAFCVFFFFSAVKIFLVVKKSMISGSKKRLGTFFSAKKRFGYISQLN